MSTSSCVRIPIPVTQPTTTSSSSCRKRHFSFWREIPSTTASSLRVFPVRTTTFFSRRPQLEQNQEEDYEEEKQTELEVEQYEVERLFSNLNQATLRREPGSLSSAIFLVAGTTVGAGILAIPAVTRESGFLASAVTCTLCWVYMVVTGLLIAEVNVNTMCELGSGGVSLSEIQWIVNPL